MHAPEGCSSMKYSRLQPHGFSTFLLKAFRRRVNRQSEPRRSQLDLHIHMRDFCSVKMRTGAAIGASSRG